MMSAALSFWLRPPIRVGDRFVGTCAAKVQARKAQAEIHAPVIRDAPAMVQKEIGSKKTAKSKKPLHSPSVFKQCCFVLLESEEVKMLSTAPTTAETSKQHQYHGPSSTMKEKSKVIMRRG